MKVQFVGATGRVTGSCYWLRDDDKDIEFLVDCGLVQGEGGGGDWNEGHFPFRPAKLEFVVLTHAHLDHCGLIPELYRQGFKGTVYATKETAELTQINLHDAVKLGGVPYTKPDVQRIKFHEPAGRGLLRCYHPVGEDLFLQFLRSSHLLGAVSAEIVWGPVPLPGEESEQKRIVFSGDLGVNREDAESQPLLRESMSTIADYAVVESTYGGRIREAQEFDYEARLTCLGNAIRQAVVEKGGTLLIPVFALGRFQDVMFDLYLLAARDPDGIGRIPILTAAPMGDRASRVYLEGLMRTAVKGGNVVKPLWRSRKIQEVLGLNPESADDEAILANLLAEAWQPPNKVERDPRRDDHPSLLVRHWARRHQVWRPGPDDAVPDLAGRIVVASGGMCEGGLIVKLLPDLLRRASTTVFLTGYQANGTNGAMLQEMKDLDIDARRRLSKTLRWTNAAGDCQTFPVAETAATIQVGIGYSGHADQAGLLDWIFYEFKEQQVVAGRTLFLTHGNNSQRRALDAAIQRRAAEVGHDPTPQVILPAPKDHWFDLDRGEWIGESEEDEIARLEARLAELRQGRAA